MTCACPHCGARLAVVVGMAGADVAKPAALRFDLPAAPAPEPSTPAGPAICRPAIAYRGEGAERESAWWARPDRAVAAGAPLAMRANNGKRWSATAAGAAAGGELVETTDSKWRPDPAETFADPDWLADPAGDK